MRLAIVVITPLCMHLTTARYKLDCVFSKDFPVQIQQPRQPKKTLPKQGSTDPEMGVAVLQRCVTPAIE